ncbi:MAG: CAP domain-containing protein [Candidatus Pacebacteria bacterium]|nr:CAP domain-containing protein [Candidatus Paceibacterota bacterium]
MKEYLIPGEHNNYKPHIFDGISTIVLAALIGGLLVSSSLAPLILNRSGLLATIYPSALVDLTNEARVNEALSPLSVSNKLTLAAQLKANDMASDGYFSHISPEGVTPWYWIGLVDYKFIYAGENLAIDFSYSDDVNDAWLASTAHRNNILSPNFTEIGIAIADGEYEGRDTTYVVQIFGTPAPITPTPVVEEKKEPPKVEVKEEVVLGDEEKYIEFQNIETEIEDIADLDEDASGVVEQAQAPGYDKYTTWYEWVVLNPKMAVEYALYAAASIIALLLILMIFINIKIQHPRSLSYGFFILAIILISIYLQKTGIATEFVNQFLY